MASCKAKMRTPNLLTQFRWSCSRKWSSKDGTITLSKARSQSPRIRSTILLILSMTAAPVMSMRRVSSVLLLRNELPFAEEDYWRENSCKNVSSSRLFRYAVLMRMEKRPNIRCPETARYPTPKGLQRPGRKMCTSPQSPTNPMAELCTPKKTKSTLDDFFNIWSIPDNQNQKSASTQITSSEIPSSTTPLHPKNENLEPRSVKLALMRTNASLPLSR